MSTRLQAKITGAFVLLCIMGATVYSVSHFGSVNGGLDYLNGRTLIVSESHRDAGVVKVGTHIPIEYKIKNVSGRPVKIIGHSTSCTCTEMQGLPESIGRSQAITLRLVVTAPELVGSFRGTVSIFVDSPTDREIQLTYQGRCN